MIRVAGAALLLSAASSLAQGPASRPDAPFVLCGRVTGPPEGAARAEVVLLDRRGVAVADVCDAHGAFAVALDGPPDGLRLRVTPKDAAPVFFDVPVGLPPGRTWLGERATTWHGPAERRRSRAAAFVFPAADDADLGEASDLVFYDATDGGEIDGRRELLRVRRRAEPVLLDPLPADLVVAVLGERDAVVVTGDFATPPAFVARRRAPDARPDASERAPSGWWELPFLLPGRAAPLRLRAPEVLSAPPERAGPGLAGALLTTAVAADGGVATARRFVGDGGAVPAAGAPSSALSVRALDAATGADVAAAFAEAGRPLDRVARPEEGLRDVDVRAEPAHEPIRVRVAPRGPDEPPAVARLQRRIVLQGAVAVDEAGVEIWRRDAPDRAPTLVAKTRAGGLYGPVLVPPREGELFARRAGEIGPAAAIPAAAEIVEAPVLRLAPSAAATGRVRTGATPAPGVAVRLVPSPTDRALLGELRLPASVRSAAASRLLRDARARTAATDREGKYRFEDVATGRYVWIVEAEGRRPIVAADVELAGPELRLDADLDAAPIVDLGPFGASEPGAATFAAARRVPYGPEVFRARAAAPEPFALGGGFFATSAIASPRPDAFGDRVLHVRLPRPGPGGAAAPALLHVWPEDVAAGGPIAWAIATPGDAACGIPLRGPGRVLLRAAGFDRPWTTCGPYETRGADLPARPILVDPGRGRVVVARVRGLDGLAAADAAVLVEPERDRAVLGAAPPFVEGVVRGDGVVSLPEIPEGRARLVVLGGGGEARRLLDESSREVLGDVAVSKGDEASLATTLGSDDVATDADGRRLDAFRAALRDAEGSPTLVRTATPPRADDDAGPATVLLSGLGRPVPDDAATPPMVLAFSDVRPGARVALVPRDGGDVASPVGVRDAFVDRFGEARFPAAPPGDWSVVLAAEGSSDRTWRFVRAAEAPGRVVLGAPPTARLVLQPFDAWGRRRLVGAEVVVRRDASAAGGPPRPSVVAKGKVLGDGRAEFVVPAGEALIADVFEQGLSAVARRLIAPIPEGATFEIEEWRARTTDVCEVFVRAAKGSRAPVVGACVVASVDGRWFADARTDVEGVARLGLVPESASLRVAADSFAPDEAFFEGPPSGGTRRVDVELAASEAVRAVFERFDPWTTRLTGGGVAFEADARTLGPRGSLFGWDGRRPDGRGEAVLRLPADGPAAEATAIPGAGLRLDEATLTLPPGASRRVRPEPR